MSDENQQQILDSLDNLKEVVNSHTVMLKAAADNMKEMKSEMVGDETYKRPGLIRRVSIMEEWRVGIDLKMARYAGIVIVAGLLVEAMKYIAHL